MADPDTPNKDDTVSIKSLSSSVTTSTQAYLDNSTSRIARLKALSDARKLVRELETGDDTWFSLISGATTAQVLRWLMHLDVPAQIPIQGSISASDLAVAIKAEPNFLTRFMRPACASGIFEEVDADVYAHTKASLTLLSPGYGPYFELVVDEMVTRCFSRYPEYFANRPLAEPSDPKHNPFAWANDMDGSMWHEVFAKDPTMYNKFVQGMKAKWAAWSATGVYPFDTEVAELSAQAVDEDGVFMVDVGGSHGATMVEIREAYPGLEGKMVVQDIPPVVSSIPAGELPAGIEAQAHDFWTPQPIKAAKVYWLRRIMHDWPDSQCEIILKHLADAMTDESKILIVDLLIPERVQMEETFCYWMDLTMMMFAGKERTEPDWRRLFEASGLKLVKIWQAEIGQQAVMEGRKKRTTG